jgi:hypothetical protein
MFTSRKWHKWALAAAVAFMALAPMWATPARADEPCDDLGWSDRCAQPTFAKVIDLLQQDREENAALVKATADLSQANAELQDRLERLESLFRKDPSLTEIWNATPLNDLLADAEKLQGQGIEGPATPLAGDIVGRINVTSGQGRDNPGMLKNAGHLTWPLVLAGAEFKASRDLVNVLALKLIHEAQSSGVDAGDFQEVTVALAGLRAQLHNQIEDLPASRYIDGKRFLDDMDDALRAMSRPDAANNFNGQYAAQGRTVPELVRYMAEHGLQFAPAVAGDQTAYTSLYRALVSYDFSARSKAVNA